MGPLKKVLDGLPLAQLLDLIPEEASQLKEGLALITGLTSRIVVSLGNAAATVDTVAPVSMPAPVDPTDPETEEPTDGEGAPPPLTQHSADHHADLHRPAARVSTTAPPGDLDASPLGAGLPALFSIPGLLLFGGIALATVAGSYFRRLGAAALGAGAPCPHGLASGLPDLRKA